MSAYRKPEWQSVLLAIVLFPLILLKVEYYLTRIQVRKYIVFKIYILLSMAVSFLWCLRRYLMLYRMVSNLLCHQGWNP